MEKLHTPRTPRLKKIAGLALLCISWNLTLSQNPKNGLIDLKNLETYEQSLTDFYVKKWKSERSEFEIVNEKKIWQYLPSVGIQFGLPSINYNPYQLFQARQDKKILAAKVQSIDKKYLLEYQDQIQAIRNEYVKIQLEIEALKREEKRLQNETKFFNDFTSNEEHDKIITPKEFRVKIMEMEEKSNNYEKMKDIIALKILDFYKLSKYQLPTNNPFH